MSTAASRGPARTLIGYEVFREMADRLTKADLAELIEFRAEQLVSVLMPTQRRAPQNDQDRIRLRNLLDQAERQLVGAGVRAPDVRELLAPAMPLLEPGPFWSYQSDGLAVFLAPRLFRTFRLPVALPELVVVSDRFHIKPLLPLLAADQRFYVLALSQDQVRLIEGNRQHAEEIELNELPSSLQDTLRFDELAKQRQAHSVGRGTGGLTVFHGHGIGGEVDKTLLERYLREIDDGLWRGVLHDAAVPLVLAGVEYERAMFRGITRYPNVLERGIDGNPERLSATELHRRAWPIVEPIFTRMRGEAARRVEQAAGRGTGVASELDVVVRSAMQGRIDSLLVAGAVQRWGTVDERTFEVHAHAEHHSGDRDLLDLAAVETLLGDGAVLVMEPEEIPGGRPAVALLRY